MKRILRSWRAFWYRHLPPWLTSWHLKRLVGFERRWDLEGEGFTKQGFVRILRYYFLRRVRAGNFLELQAGDGLVGSLGAWLEQIQGWKVTAWEHRPNPCSTLRRNRPLTKVQEGRLTHWDSELAALDPVGITSRGIRESIGVCRAIREGLIHPCFVGIWNPSRRRVWEHRLRRQGYRLELVYHRMEFYRCVKQ